MIEQFQIGQKKYQVNAKIGEGAAGTVYLVVNIETKVNYAVKVIYKYEKSRNKKMVDDEIKMQKQFFESTNIIKCYASQVKYGNIYILFQLGEFSLRNRLNFKQFVQDDYYDMIMQVARGLNQIHAKGYIHRDIKPQNIIVKDGIYKITDFGTGSLKETDNSFVGTPLYWPPEMLFDTNECFTQKIDVWSLGIVAFEAYFLTNPFYYEDYQVQRDQKQVLDILKKNIKYLTPKFTIKNLIQYLKIQGFKKKASFISQKLQATTNQLINTFQTFFQTKPQDRPQSDMMLVIFLSLSEKVKEKPMKSSRIKEGINLPLEVKFFVQTKDLFYEIDSKLKYPKSKEVQLALQLAVWMIGKILYQNQNMIQYECSNSLNSYKKKNKTQNWRKIQQILCQYYFQLNKGDHQFYQNLTIFRYRILICSIWNVIMRNNKQFCKLLRKTTNYQINSIQDMVSYLPTFTEKQIGEIQKYSIQEVFR